jgi:branched-chain amino acid transport system permease protein
LTPKGSSYLRALTAAAGASAVLLAMPSVLPAYPLLILSQMLVISIACLGLNLIYGTTGLLSLGHATFFGIAAYTGAFLYRFYFVESLESYLLSGVAFSTLLAVVIGFICAHASRTFFAILTLALCMLIYSLFINGAIFRLFGGLGWALYLLGGGSMYLPRLPILGTEYGPEAFVVALYYIIAAALVASGFVLWQIGRSPFGLALRAIRDNDTRAAFIGIPVRQYRWYAFILSGFFMAVAGGLYGPLARQITPEQLHWFFSAQLIVAVVLGGSRHFVGPILGAFAFVGLDEMASRWPVGRYALFGVLLILVIYLFPRGIAGGLERVFAGWRRGKAWA